MPLIRINQTLFNPSEVSGVFSSDGVYLLVMRDGTQVKISQFAANDILSAFTANNIVEKASQFVESLNSAVPG